MTRTAKLSGRNNTWQVEKNDAKTIKVLQKPSSWIIYKHNTAWRKTVFLEGDPRN